MAPLGGGTTTGGGGTTGKRLLPPCAASRLWGIEEEESFFGGEEKLGFLRYCCEEKREPNQYYAWLRVPLRVVTISTSDEKTDANHEKDREEEDES